MLAHPAYEWRSRFELPADACACSRPVQPWAELVAPSDRQPSPSQQIQTRVIGRVATRCSNEVGLVQLETCIPSAADRPGEHSGGAPGIDSTPQAIDLVWSGVMQPRGNQQSVE